MKVLDSVWFSEMGSMRPIGIVTVEDPHDGVVRFIGTASGLNEQADALYIAMHGAKFHYRLEQV